MSNVQSPTDRIADCQLPIGLILANVLSIPSITGSNLAKTQSAIGNRQLAIGVAPQPMVRGKSLTYRKAPLPEVFTRAKPRVRS